MRGKSAILLAGVIGFFVLFCNYGFAETVEPVESLESAVGAGTYIIPTIDQIMGDWSVILIGKSVSNVGGKAVFQDRIILVLKKYIETPYPNSICYDASGVIFDATDKERQKVLGNGSLGFCNNTNYVWGWHSFYVDGCWETYSSSLFFLSNGKMEGVFNGYVWDGNVPAEFIAGTATLRN